MTQAISLLTRVFGHDAFRSCQADVCEAAISGRDVIALMGTGVGKTVCYVIPMLARQGVGVVVSPLKALIFDQVSRLQSLGLSAASVNGDVTGYERQNILEDVRRGRTKFLYVTPEMVAQPWFQAFLSSVAISAFAIDEAHCASQYGHDSRPDYKTLGVLKLLYPSVPRIAVSATADKVTLEDMRCVLNMEDAIVFKGDLDRKNIALSVFERQSINKHRSHLKDILDAHKGESGIVYCTGQASVDTLADWMIAEGYKALPYHAGMDRMDREINQDRFSEGDIDILVSTVAFGMGVDKSDIRFVIHDNMPASLESYTQEIGRAGRDGETASAYMFFSNKDVVQRRRMIKKSASGAPRKRTEYARLDQMMGFCETYTCRRRALLRYFGTEMEFDCGDCDNCNGVMEAVDLGDLARDILGAVQSSAKRINAFDVVQDLRSDNVKTSSIIRQLMVEGHLVVDHSDFGALSITSTGTAIADGSMPYVGNDRFFLTSGALLPVMKKPAARKERETTKRTSWSRSENTVSTVRKSRSSKGSPLLEALRKQRNAFARSRNVKRFMIVHDQALKQMSEVRPKTFDELGLIKGVGPVTVERYGATLLNIIREYA